LLDSLTIAKAIMGPAFSGHFVQKFVAGAEFVRLDRTTQGRPSRSALEKAHGVIRSTRPGKCECLLRSDHEILVPGFRGPGARHEVAGIQAPAGQGTTGGHFHQAGPHHRTGQKGPVLQDRA
jgi:hypothetical protein